MMKFKNKNINIGTNVKLGQNVKIGDNTTIYDNVIIGDNTLICNDCVIGEPLNKYYTDNNYENPVTVIGNNGLIRSHAIIYAGVRIGEHLSTGHRVTIREFTEAGNHCMFGSYNDIQGFCKIGDYNRYHSFVNIGQESDIGNYVFIYPFVVITNDPTPPSNTLRGVKIGHYSQITSGAVLLPGCIIGNHSLVAANSTVGGDYPDDSFISGSPAQHIGKLSKMPFFNAQKKRHYPWPYHFDRGMPWENIGFENWESKQH